MKSCLVLFKNPKELIDFKTVNSVLDTLNGANFSVDDIFTFSNTENNLICEKINKIRQSYDTVYVLNCNQESKLDSDFDQKAVYYLDGNYMRFDWPGGVLELPYDITLSDSYSKDKTTRKHLDGTTSVYYNDGVTRTGKQSTRLVRLMSQRDIELVRSLARYPGNAFIRLPDGCAYEGCVEITDISTEGVIDTFSLSTIETATTQAYMLPIPVAESEQP
jgi:hypothetical protein